MCLLNFVLYFKINYKCNYGDSVFIVGNTEALGNWNPARAIKLEWSDGHNWSKKISIVHDNTQLIEYKYIITSGAFPTCNVKWEDGPNHFIDLMSASKLMIKLNDEWEHMKVEIALYHEAIKDNIDSDKRIILYSGLDQGKSMYQMKLKKHIFENGAREELFWTASLSVPNTVKAFNYKYKMLDKAENEAVVDRNTRKFLFKKFPYHTNAKESHFLKASKMVKYDFVFATSLSYASITEDLIVGTYPQNPKDIEDLAAMGVKAVLNLQTFGDMMRYEEDWEMLQDLYKMADIEVAHLPIIDMHVPDLTLKINDATETLHELLKRGKVFVHCTAGRHRSPHVVISYLYSFRNYNLKDAVKLVKSKRARVKVFEEVFSQRREESLYKVKDFRGRG